jgi:hypothetical protein
MGRSGARGPACGFLARLASARHQAAMDQSGSDPGAEHESLTRRAAAAGDGAAREARSRSAGRRRRRRRSSGGVPLSRSCTSNPNRVYRFDSARGSCPVDSGRSRPPLPVTRSCLSAPGFAPTRGSTSRRSCSHSRRSRASRTLPLPAERNRRELPRGATAPSVNASLGHPGSRSDARRDSCPPA